MKAKIYSSFLCPGCDWVLYKDENRETLSCMNKYCEYYGKQFELPTIEIKLVKKRS